MNKVALIISVYKNTKDLEVVLRSVEQQSINNIQVIISEDGNNKEMYDFIKKYSGSLILNHLFQEDIGWRKNKALNNAIKFANADYLIFIDGDCVLHTNFIENHLYFAKKNRVLAGKRIKLGSNYSDKLRKLTKISDFISIVIPEYFKIKKDGAKFCEEAIYISPNSVWKYLFYMRKMTQIKGCNFSCYKSALEDINGYNEDYVLPAIGEDIDLTWRFRGLKYNIFSLRNFAVQYHLFHKENWNNQSVNYEIMLKNKKNHRYITQNGLKKL